MHIENLVVGQSASLTCEVSQEVINAFAKVTGDHNPVHVDPEFASGTMFKGVIAHGMLLASYISAVLGTQLPGAGAIYMRQALKFCAPVHPGDTVVTTCTVKEIIPEKERVIMETVCKVGDTLVLEGEATLMVPSGTRPDKAQA